MISDIIRNRVTGLPAVLRCGSRWAALSSCALLLFAAGCSKKGPSTVTEKIVPGMSYVEDSGVSPSSSVALSASAAALPPGSDAGAFCGDGQVNGVEQCDDGNSEDADGCSHVTSLRIAVTAFRTTTKSATPAETATFVEAVAGLPCSCAGTTLLAAPKSATLTRACVKVACW
jgi:cysteine-rich repeat protein